MGSSQSSDLDRAVDDLQERLQGQIVREENGVMLLKTATSDYIVMFFVGFQRPSALWMACIPSERPEDFNDWATSPHVFTEVKESGYLVQIGALSEEERLIPHNIVPVGRRHRRLGKAASVVFMAV
jgi:hypothetical protein